MRIGSVLIFLVMTWIGLGFLLSDDLNTHQTVGQIQQQAEQAIQDRKTMQDQLNQANVELNTCKTDNDHLTQQNSVLQEQVKGSQNENQNLKSQNADLQNKLDEIKKIDSFIEDLVAIPPESMLLAIFAPILPVSLVASFVVYRHSRRSSGRKPGRASKPERTMSINITEEEMRRIVKMRRGQQ
jgi:ATP-dependent Zn protease